MALANGIYRHLRALFGHSNDSTSPTAPDFDVEAEVKQVAQKPLSINLDPSTNAVLNTTKRHVLYARNNLQIQAVKYVPDGTLTVNATNFATLTLYSGNGAAAAATAVGVLRTNAGSNWVAGTPQALTLTAAQQAIDADSTLAAEILKSGAGGVAVPKGSLVIYYEER